MQTLRNLANLPKRRPLVVGVGWPKTGLTSLRDALTILGWRVKGYDHQRITQWTDGVTPTIPRYYNAFRDQPWTLMFREFDQRGAKPILTVRDPDRWFDSYGRQAAQMGPSTIRERLMGFAEPAGHKAEFVARYQAHNEEVREHFAGRDLLVVDWEAGDGWGELCGFLDASVPDVPFPHSQPRLSV